MIVAFTCAAAFAQQPRIDGVLPAEGPIAGGTLLTVRGAGFTNATVKFDHATITPLSQSDSEVRIQAPRHDNGYALIQIGSAAAEYLYLPPRLDELPPGYITTIAGVGRYLRLELPAKTATVNSTDLTITPNGDLYFMQVDRGLLFRVGTDGILHHVAGTLGAFDFNFIGDGGPAKDAVFGFARSVGIDASGNAYITDVRNRIRRIEAATGIVRTVAGTGERGFSGDGGPATEAKIGEPSHVACAPDGTFYFMDGLEVAGGGTPRNLRIRKVTPAGIITTVAGNGSIGDGGDGGPAVAAPLNIGVDDDGDVAIDAAGNVFILEGDGQRIRRVDAQTGTIGTFASLAFPPPNEARNPRPAALAIDSTGNVFVVTSWNILKFDLSGRLVESWGVNHGYSPDGTLAKQMNVGGSTGAAIAPNGDLVYSDSIAGGTIRKISMSSGKLETVAGTSPNLIGVPGRALGAVFLSSYSDLAFLPTGDLVFADPGENWVFRIDLRTGTMSPFAGTGMACCKYEEATADVTSMNIAGLEPDASGNVYVVDKSTVRVIDTNGIVHRIAGVANGVYGFAGDGGPARDAMLCQPNDVAIDRAGNLYIADTNNNRIRRVDKGTGNITTVAGSGPSNGFEGYGRGSFCGDGGPATSGCLNTPVALAVRKDGSMYINDFYNTPKIRKVAADGSLSSLVTPQPTKLLVGPAESIISPANNGVIFRIDGDRVRTIAGTGIIGFFGDGGPASNAQIAPGSSEYGEGIAADADGNLFFHDAGNARIRAIRYGAVLAPPSATVQATLASGSTIRATVFDSSGQPAPGVRVDFTAPSSGSSCHFANNSNMIGVVTDANGVAATTCVPNCAGNGSFVVTARPLTAAVTSTVTMSDTAGPCRRRAVRY